MMCLTTLVVFIKILLKINNRNRNRNRNMFTIKYVNYTAPKSETPAGAPEIEPQDEPAVDYVSLRAATFIDLYYPTCSAFMEKIDEVKSLNKDTPDGFTGAIESCKGLIVSDSGDYFIGGLEDVYITDQSGKTVHSIK